MNVTASIIMGVALILYTIGVWSEKFQGRLKLLHLLFFILGLICDSWGTGIMFGISEGISFSFHGIAGIIAIILMFIHAIWAAVVLIKNEEKAILKFHKFSLFVWILWLIPYLSPMFIHISSGI
jgi:uncharacterized repeat protein (TIGR03987 family)